MNIKSPVNNIVISWKMIISSLIIIAMAVVSFWTYSKVLNNYLKEEAIKYLIEVAQSNKFTVYQELNEKQLTLFQISSFIENEPNINLVEIRERLKHIFDINYFKRIGIIYPNRQMYIINNLGKEAVQYNDAEDYFDKSIQGKTAISYVSNDSIDGKESIILSCPWYEDDQIKGVLFIAYDVNTLQKILSLELFDKKGYSIIIDKDGNRIIAGMNAIKIKNDTNNVFTNLNNMSATNKQYLDKAQKDLAAGKSGLIPIYAYEEMYLYYQPLQKNDMSLLTIIPKSVIDTKYEILMRNTYILSIVLLVLAVAIIANIVLEERKKKKHLENILYKDKVTGGYSYAKFCKEVEIWLRLSSAKKAFVAVDVDNFKLINEIFGYEVGNTVLSDIWQVLHNNLKRYGIVTRTYADNFLIAVEFEDKSELVALMENIIKGIAKITTIQIEKYRIIPSIGTYIIEDNDKSIENIQNCAILARRMVKNRYDIAYSFYYSGIKEAIIEKKSIMDGILQALARNEFQVYYQPKYDAKKQKVVGSEALIRWIRAGKIFMSPAKFIPIAEEVGIIADVDKRVFETVCIQQKKWKEKGMRILPVSVNVSRDKLYRPNFIEEYVQILHRYGLDTKDIQIEITEGNLISEQKVGEQIVNKIRQMGFDVLIDDFGTGYSSISMIRDVNATEMKIDKSFVDDMSSKGRAIIRHVIDIAKIVGMKTVAEGVETKEQYEFLRDNNCDIIQGYYFAKPMPFDEYETYLN